jgi:hypothetical protein
MSEVNATDFTFALPAQAFIFQMFVTVLDFADEGSDMEVNV